MSAMHIVRLMLRPKLAGLRLGPEDKIAIDFATQLRVLTIEGRIKAVWTHIPNEMAGAGGGDADPKVRKRLASLAHIRYAIAKALGMIPGVSDYVFLWETGSGALEAKAPGGTQEDIQKDFEKWCNDNGVPYRIFRTPEEGFEVLREWGILK